MFDINIGILISQTINFLVLFYILNRFLFKPISSIIDKRKEEIGKLKEEAVSANDQAKNLKDECQRRLDSIQGEIEDLRQQKIAEIQDQVNSIINNAQIKANTFMEEAELEVLLERMRAWKDIHSNVTKLATSAAEKIIEESLDDDMHRKLISRAITKIEKEMPAYDLDQESSKQLPKQYAEDFFALIDTKGLKPQYADFNAFIKIYNDDEELRNVLESPTIHVERKIEIVNKVFKGKLKEEVTSFIIKLLTEKHMYLINKISNEVRQLFHNRRCIKGIRIRTRVPLTQDEKELLYKVITKKFGSIEVEQVVDKNLVGGLIVQLNGQIVDVSIDAKIKQLREALNKVESQWHQQLLDAPSLAL